MRPRTVSAGWAGRMGGERWSGGEVRPTAGVPAVHPVPGSGHVSAWTAVGESVDEWSREP